MMVQGEIWSLDFKSEEQELEETRLNQPNHTALLNHSHKHTDM